MATYQDWQAAMRETIAEIQERAVPWVGGGTGVTVDLVIDGKRFMKRDQHSYCSGAAFEAFVLTCQRLSLPLDWDLATRLKPWFYINGFEEHPERETGPAGGVVDAGIATWISDPQDALYGDIAQWQWSYRLDPGAGHACILTEPPEGQAGEAGKPYGLVNGTPALWCWTSNQGVAGITGEGPGHQTDWFALTKPGRDRRIHIARLTPSFLGG